MNLTDRKLQFIKLAKQKHNNLYNYDNIKYVNSNIKINILCTIHNIEFSQIPAAHLLGKVGCPKCIVVKRQQTLMERYGVKHALQSIQSQEKFKHTCQERYGVPHHFKSIEIQNKKYNTNLAKYGVKHPLQSEHILSNMIETNLAKYGSKYTTQVEEFKNKKVDEFIKNYGVDNPFKSTKIQTQIKTTTLERYGVDNIFKSKEIQQKIKATNIARYGVDNPSKNLDIQKRRTDTILKKYGYPNYTQYNTSTVLDKLLDFNWLFTQYIQYKKSAKQLAIELNISQTTMIRYLRSAEIQIRKGTHSYIAIQWLESIMQRDNIFIQHAGNIGEYYIPGSYPVKITVDGYCKDTNTCYEFHGDYWHGNPIIYAGDTVHPILKKTFGELYLNTKARENRIKLLGYNLITIWESEIINI